MPLVVSRAARAPAALQVERLYLDGVGRLVSLSDGHERGVEAGDELYHSSGDVYFVLEVNHRLDGRWNAPHVDTKITVRRRDAETPTELEARFAATRFQRIAR